jgi:hypothetical protein
MQVRSVLLIAMGVTGAGLIVVFNMLFYAILGEVNGASSPSGRISPFGANVRLFEIYRRHQMLFPDSRLRTISKLVAASGMLLFFTAVVAGIIINSVSVP